MFCQASGIAQLPAKWVKTLWVTRMGRGRHQSTPPSGKYLLCSWGNEGRVLERICSASGGLIFLRNRSVPRTRNLLRLVKGKGLTEQTLWNLTGPQDIMGQERGQAAFFLEVLLHPSHNSLCWVPSFPRAILKYSFIFLTFDFSVALACYRNPTSSPTQILWP